MNAWHLTYDGFDPAEEGRRETLCTLGNGYFATRGAAPESRAGEGVHYPGTYAAGCYNTLSDTVAGETVENESLVNLPNWLPLTFRVDDGPWFRLDAVELLEHRQELDLERGVLTRFVRFRDAEGRLTRLAERRFVHLEYKHLGGLQTTIVAENWSGALVVRSFLDGTVRNDGVPRYRELSSRHLRTVCAQPVGTDTVLLEAATSQSHIRVAEAARTRVLRGGAPLAVERTLYTGRDEVGHDLALELGEGESVTVEKIVTLFTSRDNAVSEPALAATDWLTRVGGFDELLERHTHAWARLWRRCAIAIEGNDTTLGILRLHMFHVLQTVSENSVDLDAGVPARGLHGEAYRGHVLWDELFVFPILNLRVPVLTRALLRYRYRRLDRARWAAADEGWAGAMYPWQSGSDGREVSQRIHLNPNSGRWVPDPTRLQRHIGIAVAYNVWQYYQATGDLDFLIHFGGELILEIARFWNSVAKYDHSRDRYVIRGVMGPDEFHTGYPDAAEDGVDNNAYTNVMVAWLLVRALDVLRVLPEARRVELTEALRLTSRETGRWEEVSRKLFVPLREDGIIEQFQGYDALAEFDWDGYRARYGDDLRRLDRILEAEGDSPNRYKASKQADVLMLFYLLSADELGELLERLGYRWDAAMIPANIEYYLARTCHGSTLSAVVHAWVLARAHRHQALDYFLEALRSDVADVQGGTTPEGIHLAAMAGSIDVLQRCFGGVELREDELRLDPYWPSELGVLQFTMRYRKHTLKLRVSSRRVHVAANTGAHRPIRIRCRGECAELGPGETVTFHAPTGR